MNKVFVNIDAGRLAELAAKYSSAIDPKDHAFLVRMADRFQDMDERLMNLSRFDEDEFDFTTGVDKFRP